jgi:hypothetical protein
MGSTPVVKPPSPIPSSPIQTLGPVVKFKTDDVPPSQYLYFQQNDLIIFNVLNNTANNVLNVRYRFLTPQGEIKEGLSQFQLVGNIVTFQLPFLEGWLLSMGFQLAFTLLQSQWVFVQAATARGFINSPNLSLMGNFWEGYVSFNGSTGWPGTPAQRIGDGPGVIRSVTGTHPAAGSDIVESPQLNRRWLLLTFSASLTTSAAVANRTPVLAVLDRNVAIVYRSIGTQNQVASQTVRYTAMNLIFANVAPPADQIWNCPLPLPLGQGMGVETFTGGIQAGDQWTSPEYTCLEWGNWDNN